MDELIKVILESKSTLNEDELRNSKDLYGDGILDSLDILIAINEINDAFGIKIGAYDIDRKDFMSVEAIYEFVQKHRKLDNDPL